MIPSVCECDYMRVFRGFRERELQCVSEALRQLQLPPPLPPPAPSFHVLLTSHHFLMIKDPHRTGVMQCVMDQNELGNM